MDLAPMRPQAFRSTIYQKASAFGTAVGGQGAFGISIAVTIASQLLPVPEKRSMIHQNVEMLVRDGSRGMDECCSNNFDNPGTSWGGRTVAPKCNAKDIFEGRNMGAKLCH